MTNTNKLPAPLTQSEVLALLGMASTKSDVKLRGWHLPRNLETAAKAGKK